MFVPIFLMEPSGGICIFKEASSYSVTVLVWYKVTYFLFPESCRLSVSAPWAFRRSVRTWRQSRRSLRTNQHPKILRVVPAFKRCWLSTRYNTLQTLYKSFMSETLITNWDQSVTSFKSLLTFKFFIKNQNYLHVFSFCLKLVFLHSYRWSPGYTNIISIILFVKLDSSGGCVGMFLTVRSNFPITGERPKVYI